MDKQQQRDLRAKAHHLKSRLTIGKNGVTDAVLAQIRQLFDQTDLLKIRIQETDREEVSRIATEIAKAVPCELVGRMGFVATYYHSTAGDGQPTPEATDAPL